MSFLCWCIIDNEYIHDYIDVDPDVDVAVDLDVDDGIG